ncbi:phosphoglycerate dehydrogenase-like enzyme [Methylobacterium sp. PvP062]|jgi:phosphoglycerate dehydrogenase-like enzyme|uniref:Phosphoglycerate dehydrogenase-like enzyme n=1 Tax=Methylobacterium radiotolerans TaxID=31998 RepID=A0ABV2NM58_9HYPH|nr:MULTISPECIES: D-2-hydroxyacid dehydrogenase family protein [Methylobacterium]MCX7332051.1 D-2-hydroxyacid dehydrogenase family protein [Hyphomicrobiales bacterium]GAN49315.1 2-hydroxyacid-family dehydrogenase [Methylobacterium sp. ME121]MBN6819697.1 D-2-hydroxyacid dehydrogenase family protein [Methylobacterium organophilum]MBP2495686.1 phosphoglycerate dehydrogenase-like enzyme [Methylobacterium sp. PvP105]MBP2504443.1 phosphoglycerate dehydrogenase-like enzyme [Methylobacterium sp. PvP109
MRTCLILDDYQQAALALADWTRLSDRVAVSAIAQHIANPDDLVARIAQAEILVIMRERTPFPAALLERLPRLELLVTSGMRNLAIDLAAARARNVVVCGTDSSPTPPTELTWALILGLARHVAPESLTLRAGGPWQSTIGTDLAGATLGVLGLGKIGTRVAEIGRAFGMRVIAWSPNLDDARAAAAGVERAASKEALLEASDVVTIHLVLGDRTRGLLGAAELRRMRRDAFLVNTSRAPIVDQAALLQALEEGWIAGAGLDVFETEPLPADSPFRRLPNVLALPHLGYVSRSNYRTFFTQAVEDIEAWLAGAPIRRLG